MFGSCCQHQLFAFKKNIFDYKLYPKQVFENCSKNRVFSKNIF